MALGLWQYSRMLGNKSNGKIGLTQLVKREISDYKRYRLVYKLVETIDACIFYNYYCITA